MSYATRMLGRRELADEVCVDVFCTVLEGRWRPEGSFRSYLFTVLHRRCIEEIRRRGARDRLQVHVPAPAAAAAVDDALADADEARRLTAAMDALGEEHRAVLLLYYSQELPSR